MGLLSCSWKVCCSRHVEKQEMEVGQKLKTGNRTGNVCAHCDATANLHRPGRRAIVYQYADQNHHLQLSFNWL